MGLILKLFEDSDNYNKYTQDWLEGLYEQNLGFYWVDHKTRQPFLRFLKRYID